VYCFCAGRHASSDTLSKASEFVGKPMDPLVFGGALRESMVFQGGLVSDGLQYDWARC
jgi:hypothetical protein